MNDTPSSLPVSAAQKLSKVFAHAQRLTQQLATPRLTYLYIRVWGNVIMFDNLNNGDALQIEPYCAFKIEQDDSRTVVATGTDAKKMKNTEGVQVVNPFGHSRTALSDPALNAAVISAAISELLTSKHRRQNCVAIIHLKDRLDGGLTKLEKSAAAKLDLGVKTNLPYSGDDLELPTAKSLVLTHIPAPSPTPLPVILLNMGIVTAIALAGLVLLVL